MSTHDINGRPTDPDTHTATLGFFDDVPFMYEFTDANGPMRCHPASGVGPLTLHMKRPHVATLPDGRTVDLPAGTVLREDDRRDALTVLAEFEREAKAAAGHAQRVLAAETCNVNKLLNVASQALDMLRRARPWIAPTVPEGLTGPQPQPAATVAPLRAEIDAFLARWQSVRPQGLP